MCQVSDYAMAEREIAAAQCTRDYETALLPPSVFSTPWERHNVHSENRGDGSGDAYMQELIDSGSL